MINILNMYKNRNRLNIWDGFFIPQRD